MESQRVQSGLSTEQWQRIDQAIAEEIERTRVARRFLPRFTGPLASNARAVPAEILDFDAGTVDDVTTLPIVEVAVDFFLNKQQVAEQDLSSALPLFRRGANVVARMEDAILFLGQPGADEHNAQHLNLPRIGVAGGWQNGGLVGGAPQPVPVARGEDRYGEELVLRVGEAIGMLEGRGYSPPFALVFGTRFFSEALRPSPGSLVLPKDRIDPLVDGQFWRSGVMQPEQGVLVSLGGEPVDLAVAKDATGRFVRVDENDIYVFRVYERFALRIKQVEALVRFECQ